MSLVRSAWYSGLSLLHAASCQPPAVQPRAGGPAPVLAETSATGPRASEARVSGVAFEPLVNGARREFFGECPQVHASSTGLYSITALGEDSKRFQVRLQRDEPEFERLLEGVDWLKGATHPRRPELILTGAYTGAAPALLRPGAPARGLFVVALEPSGKVLWQRVIESEHPWQGLRTLLLADGSVAAWGSGELAPLFGEPTGTENAQRRFTARLDGNGAPRAFTWHPERTDLLGMAGADAGVMHELMREPSGTVVLRRLDARNRILSSVALRYGDAGPLSADPRGGVWIFVRVALDASRPSAGLLHYDRVGTLVEEIELAERGRPAVTEPGAPPYVPPLANPAGLVTDAGERLWILGRFRSQLTLLGSSIESRAERGDWYLGATRRGRPESLLLLSGPRSELELQPFGERVLLSERNASGGCRVDSLALLPGP